MSLSRRELLKTSAFAIAGTAIGLDDAKSSAAAQAPAHPVDWVSRLQLAMLLRACDSAWSDAIRSGWKRLRHVASPRERKSWLASLTWRNPEPSRIGSSLSTLPDQLTW